MSLPRASACCARRPGTSAQRLTAGTIRCPSASWPTVAGAPPPDANTRSKSASERPDAFRKPATTPTTPLRFAMSRMSSDAHESTWSSVCSSRRARYSVGSAERPVAATRPPSVRGRAEYARGLCRTLPARPLVVQLGQPAPERPGPRRIGIAAGQFDEGGLGTRGEGGERLAGGPGSSWDRLTDAHADPTPAGKPRGAIDRHGHDGQTCPQGEVGDPFIERVDLGLVGVDPALGGDPERSAALEEGRDSSRRIEQIALAGLVRNGHSRQRHEQVVPAGGHVLLLRS